MTETERLRELLDERGVEWRRTPHYSSESIDNETVFRGEGIEWIANGHLNGHIGLRALRYEVTPEQAVEATLGRGECKAWLYKPEHGSSDCTICECGEINDISANYCNRCGRQIKVVSE